MKIYLKYIFLCVHWVVFSQQVQLLDSASGEPVSFATIAFGNGWGTHADANGKFTYSEKLFVGIDTLYISAVGYGDIQIPVPPKETVYKMTVFAEQLGEVILTTFPDGKYKPFEIKPISHSEYHDSWMQTVESEIAVLISKPSDKPAHLTKLYLPVNVQENVQGKKIDIRSFATMMRVNFYENDQGKPGRELSHGNIVFIVTEKNVQEVYTLDVSSYKILIPKDGIFVSIQVLGPTDSAGDLLQTRTYNEFETKQGITRVAISFRPLLPMTNTLRGEKTFVRRVFLDDKSWHTFNIQQNPNSLLLRRGFNNYGMGARMHIYND
ncbi:MAG TPA: hypothetical protein VKZ42_02735 [Flavobacteriaceae bacterium]|nr:hypothetical protein [Flavobacteriaceae bacterium]